jgi:hypothetical protein
VKAESKRKSAVERFWVKIQKTEDGCWRWLASKDRDGYPLFDEDTRHRGKRIGERKAHRFAYKTFRAPIPEGHELHHKCPHKDCCNPTHLEPKVLLEHLKIHSKSNRMHCPRGHPFNEINTYLYKTSRGHTGRCCRTCRRENMRRYKQEGRSYCLSA